MKEPHFIGWYHEHPIRIYRDDDERPWLVVFEATPLTDASGNSLGELKYAEEREPAWMARSAPRLPLLRTCTFEKSCRSSGP